MPSISPFVVGSSGAANFHKIQDAIDSAHKSGGGAVYVQPGFYNENLKLFDGIDLCGAGGIADCQSCVIFGSHIPPTHGSISIRNLSLKNTNSIFDSLEPGVSSIFLNSCFIGVENGYVFNLPNWRYPGKFVGFDLGDTDSLDNGFINNRKGASALLVAATIGKGSKSMNLSGEINFFTVQSSCPITIAGDAKACFYSGCCVEKALSLEDRASLMVANSYFKTLNSPALVYNSSSNATLSEVCIDCPEKLAIDGVGKGTLTIGSITSIYPLNIAPALNTNYGSVITGNLCLSEKGKGLHIAEGNNAKMGITKLSRGATFVNTNSVTHESRIFLTVQETSARTGFVSVRKKFVGKGFELISSDKSDDSEVAWMIVEGSSISPSISN